MSNIEDLEGKYFAFQFWADYTISNRGETIYTLRVLKIENGILIEQDLPEIEPTSEERDIDNVCTDPAIKFLKDNKVKELYTLRRTGLLARYPTKEHPKFSKKGVDVSTRIMDLGVYSYYVQQGQDDPDIDPEDCETFNFTQYEFEPIDNHVINLLDNIGINVKKILPADYGLEYKLE
jgi:hypothetical protein